MSTTSVLGTHSLRAMKTRVKVARGLRRGGRAPDRLGQGVAAVVPLQQQWLQVAGPAGACKEDKVSDDLNSLADVSKVTVVEAALTLMQFVLLLVIGRAVYVKVWRRGHAVHTASAAVMAIESPTVGQQPSLHVVTLGG